MALVPGGVYDSSVYDTATYDAPAGTALVELYLGGVWTDITAYVRTEAGITIRRGRADWSQSPTYATCNLTLDNRDGRFSPRNTAGAYYGLIGRNTQIRVSVYLDDGTSTVRFHGDVSAWPVGWETSGRNVWVDVEACGLRRQLSRGASVLQSPYRRAMKTHTGIVAYWPMEETGDTTTQFGSVVQSGYALMASTTGVTAGSSTLFDAGSVTAATLSGVGASLSGQVRPHAFTGTNGVQVRGLVEVTSTTATLGVDFVVTFANGDFIVVECIPQADTIEVAYTVAATGVRTSNLYASGGDLELPARFSIEAVQNGTAVDFQMRVWKIAAGVSVPYTSSSPASTLTRVANVRVVNGGTVGGTDIVTQLCHLSVETPTTSIFDVGYTPAGQPFTSAVTGYTLENADDRARRVATEEGVSASVASAKSGSTCQAMGPQAEDTFLNLFDECAFVEDGISTEDVTTRALVFRSRTGMQSVNAVFGTTYGASAALYALQPVDDDQLTVNDVTVVRTDGGSARYQQTTGNLSVTAIGDYATSLTLNVATDDQLLPQAQWRVGEGTIDAPRWPVVGLRASKFTSPTDRTAIASLREGDYFIVFNAPSFSGGISPLKLQVAGWTEVISPVDWTFELNAFPADIVSSVFILDDAMYGILDTDRLGL